MDCIEKEPVLSSRVHPAGLGLGLDLSGVCVSEGRDSLVKISYAATVYMKLAVLPRMSFSPFK